MKVMIKKKLFSSENLRWCKQGLILVLVEYTIDQMLDGSLMMKLSLTDGKKEKYGKI